MEELDNQRCKLQESTDEVTRLKQLISAKDATIKELRASKKSIAQELETARLAAKVVEETSVTSGPSAIGPWTRLFGRGES
jgi:septal ring factor EnvC (AmiA/AmiB activator)